MTDAAISPQLVMLENRAGRVVLHSAHFPQETKK